MRTTLLLRDHLWAALGLLALPAGCLGKEDYADCDPLEVATLDPVTEDADGAVSGDLYCVAELPDPVSCLACDADCQSALESSFASAHGHSGYGYSLRIDCGPMWLDEGCCFQVSIGEWMEGRPFRVDGVARLAAARSGEGWASTIPPEALPSEHRAAIAEHWTRMALAEHASIASFARFSLQLLHLGAPAPLVLAACQAQVDEVGHASTCFALASAALGRPVGPGPLDVREGAGTPLDLRSVALATFVEGCVHETLAAAEATRAAARATWAPAREALTRIAADEARHAALAWATVQWLLRDDTELMGLLSTALLEEVHRLTARATDDAGLSEYGRLDSDERAALVEEVLAEVIAPTLEAIGRAMGEAQLGA